VDAVIDFSLKKNKLKITARDNSTFFNINANSYFFFVIEGNTKIKITYQ
jgi:hypothetical protein